MTIAHNLLILPNSTGTAVIDISNIVRIEAISNYSKLFFTNGKTLVVSKVLKWFDVLLADKSFIRIHRSHLINLSCISRFNNINHTKIILQNQELIDISRRKEAIL